MELVYLCGKLRYWLYTRKQRTRAERYSPRLQRVLRALPKDDLAIIRQEGLALLCELQGDLSGAIAHRQREIRLIERMHTIARSRETSEEARRFMLERLGAKELEERKQILAALREARQGRVAG